MGKHKVLFKVTAECNQDYFKQIGFNPGNIEEEDRCIYTVYHKVKIWRPAALNVKAFGLFALLVALLGLGVLIWWGCSFIGLRKVQLEWRDYSNLL